MSIRRVIYAVLLPGQTDEWTVIPTAVAIAGNRKFGWRPQMESLGNFLMVAAEIWGRGVAGVASNIEE